MKESKEELVDWLRDAHALESNVIKMLEKQISHLDDWPEFRQRLQSHLEESQRHATRVEQCLKAMGSDTSVVKEGMAKLTGMMSQMGIGAAVDEPVKICLGNYAIEHFEIACYRSLLAAAQHCGENEVAAVADEILQDEIAMAEYLEGNIEQVTTQHLQRCATA